MNTSSPADASAFGTDERDTPALDDQQEPALASIVHIARRPGPELHFATLSLGPLRSLPVCASLARIRTRSQSYLQRAAGQWQSRGGRPDRLVVTLSALADELVRAGQVELATSAARLAIAAPEVLLLGALEVDHRLSGSIRRGPAAKSFVTELDAQIAALTAAYPPTTLERLDVQAARAAARDCFIRAQLGLAVRRARKISRVSRVPLADLIQTGTEALIHAVDRFDPSFGAPFAAYGYAWIKQGIRRMEASADLVRLPDRVQALRFTVRRALFAAAAGGSTYRVATVAALVGRPEHVIEAVMRADAPVISLEGVTAHVIAESHAADDPEPDEGPLLEERCLAVRKALRSCTPQGRIVLERLYGIGCPQMSGPHVARLLGISSQRVYEIRDQEIRRMRHPAVSKHLIAAA